MCPGSDRRRLPVGAGAAHGVCRARGPRLRVALGPAKPVACDEAEAETSSGRASTRTGCGGRSASCTAIHSLKIIL